MTTPHQSRRPMPASLVLLDRQLAAPAAARSALTSTYRTEPVGPPKAATPPTSSVATNVPSETSPVAAEPAPPASPSTTPTAQAAASGATEAAVGPTARWAGGEPVPPPVMCMDIAMSPSAMALTSVLVRMSS